MSRPILHLLGTAEVEGIGIARIVSTIAAGLDPDKYRVDAWFLGPPGPLVEQFRDSRVTVKSIDWWRGFRDPVGAYRFWRYLQERQDFAIVHQHFGARSVRAMISLCSQAPIVVHVHGTISELVPRDSIPVAVRGADTVITVSHAAAMQFPDIKPIVVHTGVKISEELQSGRKPPATNIVIGASSRLVALKGLIYLIRAAAALGSEFPCLKVEIAGTGPEREELEREARRFGIIDRVQFLGWQRDLGSTFRRWDIFVIPSLDEGLPMAVLEAMAEGLPVVASSVGGLPEIVEDGQTGYLVPPANVQTLKERLRLLILHPEFRRAMGAAGRERVRKYFSAERMVAEISAIYDRLLERPA